MNKLESLEPEATKTPCNVTAQEKRALDELKENKDIVIKKADKTNIIVIMDAIYYRDKLILKDHLSQPTYELSTTQADKNVFKNQGILINKHKDCLTKKEIQFITNYEWKSSNFYVNPKIAKCKEISNQIEKNGGEYLQMEPPASLVGRPIIAGPASPTKHLSNLLDKILSPLVPKQKSYIKDDWAFLRYLPSKLEYDADLFTCDIVSLYTSIPHDLGTEAIQYWIQKERKEIPARFTKEFIIEAILFVLNNTNFYFNGQYYHQLQGTGMGVDFAGPYACLTVGYLEETRLFGLLAPQRFSNKDLEIIRQAFKRYVDDGWTFWPNYLDMNILIDILGNLHPNIKYTVERGKVEGHIQRRNFLDVMVILHDNRTVETEIYYKATNNHHYLEYNSFHPQHVKDNIPYTLAKRILVFTTCDTKVTQELKRLSTWLHESGYPISVIKKATHNARLQGPANNPKFKKSVIPLVTTYCDNYSNKQVVQQANMSLKNCPDDSTRKTFENKEVVLSLKQPKSILGELTRAKFDYDVIPSAQKGIYKCHKLNCKICDLYLVECVEFKTANNEIWKVPTHITCNSKCVIYYQLCANCEIVSNIGKTNSLRKRTNGHISSCRLGNSNDIFDNHVFKCKNNDKEPYFKLWVLMEVNDISKLLVYENYFHKRGMDTINREKSKV